MRALKSVTLFLCTLLFATDVHAEEYPARPIRVIVPYAPGGNSDLIARTLAPVLDTKVSGSRSWWKIDRERAALSDLTLSPRLGRMDTRC